MVKKIVEDTDKGIKKKRVSISIGPDTHKELSELGKYGESMDDIIKRVLKEAKKRADI